MTKQEKETLIQELLKSKTIARIYDNYIIKEIPFEKWVRKAADDIYPMREVFSYADIS